MRTIGLGGLHSINNIVVCCDRCNYQKGDMPLEEWLKKLGEDNPLLDQI